MANSLNLDLDAQFGVTDARAAAAKGSNTTLGDGGRVTTLLTEDNSYGSINDLDTRLQAIDGTTYTQAYLRTLNKNDKVYALRLAQDSAGVK